VVGARRILMMAGDSLGRHDLPGAFRGGQPSGSEKSQAGVNLWLPALRVTRGADLGFRKKLW